MRLALISLLMIPLVTGCGGGGDTGSCEQDHWALGNSCQSEQSVSLTACEQLVAEYCACDEVTEYECEAYTEAIENSNGDEAVCQSYIDAGVC